MKVKGRVGWVSVQGTGVRFVCKGEDLKMGIMLVGVFKGGF